MEKNYEKWVSLCVFLSCVSQHGFMLSDQEQGTDNMQYVLTRVFPGTGTTESMTNEKQKYKYFVGPAEGACTSEH